MSNADLTELVDWRKWNCVILYKGHPTQIAHFSLIKAEAVFYFLLFYVRH
jgi:hypothetical protein